MAFKMVWENESCADSIDCKTFDEAKDHALELLMDWRSCHLTDNNYPSRLEDWSEKQIEDWDYMICNCFVSVRDDEKYNEEDFGEVWSPSDKELSEIGWLDYEGLLKERK